MSFCGSQCCSVVTKNTQFQATLATLFALNRNGLD